MQLPTILTITSLVLSIFYGGAQTYFAWDARRDTIAVAGTLADACNRSLTR